MDSVTSPRMFISDDDASPMPARDHEHGFTLLPPTLLVRFSLSAHCCSLGNSRSRQQIRRQPNANYGEAVGFIEAFGICREAWPVRCWSKKSAVRSGRVGLCGSDDVW